MKLVQQVIYTKTWHYEIEVYSAADLTCIP